MIEMMHRTMAVDVGVRVKQREIDMRAVPYNEPATVWDQVEKRRYSELIAPDAFRQEKRRPNQVKLLRDHDVTRLVGSCTKVNPRGDDGLHATARVAPTTLGDESLTLADSGDLHVSIGFIPDPAFDEWSDDGETVTRHACTLWEVSLVPFPAYDGAAVLAVRSTPRGDEPDDELEPTGRQVFVPFRPAAATPNRDAVRGWLASLTSATTPGLQSGSSD